MRNFVILLALAVALTLGLPGAAAQEPPAGPEAEEPCSPLDVSGIPPDDVSIHVDCAASNVAEFLPAGMGDLFMCLFYIAWEIVGPILTDLGVQEEERVMLTSSCI